MSVRTEDSHPATWALITPSVRTSSHHAAWNRLTRIAPFGASHSDRPSTIRSAS